MTALARKTVTQNFDRAAGDYDRAASIQAQIARHLIQKAIRRIYRLPQAVLDIGCGTGFATAAAARQWPNAAITAVDGAPAMLGAARRKVSYLRGITGDIAAYEPEPVFDVILSSMALHWLSSPCEVLTRWQKGLKPQGQFFGALLVEGSFQEWHDFCAAEGIADGLWPLPSAGFADILAPDIEHQTISVDYPSAAAFLRRLKATGAATPRPDHTPLDPGVMRRLLTHAPRPFPVTYRVLYIEMQSFGSI